VLDDEAFRVAGRSLVPVPARPYRIFAVHRRAGRSNLVNSIKHGSVSVALRSRV
jgi:hypothetical protein